jgi:hypothetical protein
MTRRSRFLRAKKIDSLQELERKVESGKAKVESTESQSSSKLDYAAQKAAAAEKRKKEKQIAEVEAAIAALEEQQAQLEQLLSVPVNQTAENFQKYESVKHQIEQKLYEWELLNE